MREIKITKIEAGQRLDRFLGKCFPKASGGFIHKMLRKKNIKLNQKKAEGSEKIAEGDMLQIYFSEETFAKLGRDMPSEKEMVPKKKEQIALRKQIRVLYRDDDVLILHKPAGMLTQKAEKQDDSLNDYLIEYCQKNHLIDQETFAYFRPSVANRLDRNTSGIVLCGITTNGLQMLARLLKSRDIKKYYLAIVKGKVTKSSKITGYLTKDENKNIVTFSTRPSVGAAAIDTEYEVIDATEEASLLKIRLITGKSHQIRVHLASEGHPILGDYKYGERNANQQLKKELGIDYQLLHSYEIDFGKHLKRKVITDHVPEEFAKAMKYYHLSLKKSGKKEKKDGNMELQRAKRIRTGRNDQLHKPKIQRKKTGSHSKNTHTNHAGKVR